ncbi:hypothetical protein OG311_02550 [Streptomyces sp. NBC_01343]|uniref:hypothetical protein n=1 Tax=Streptomyces sp. NBC_01343 TaxID=2903832 RepID=UPI002E10F627|nr:hypothetical protein OG311_02550 [Streptomyces sp. NBC_01343]
MILILGLIILIAAIVVGLAGIFGNTGSEHDLGGGGDFSIFGYHATGSTGALFLIGIIVGAAALLGLALVVMGARRSARRSTRARRELGTSRREATAVEREHERERDDLIKQRDDARAETMRDDGRAGTTAPAAETTPPMAEPAAPAAETTAPVADAPRGRGRWFGHRAAPR